MSFAVLDRTESRKTLYLSTDGAGQIPLEFLLKLPDKSVIVALDFDRDGNLMAQRVITQLPNSVLRLPKATDWNEELLNAFNLEVTRRQSQQSQQQSPSQQRGHGIGR
jgi:5S rRNA maturation endonuclease (ribonuclease M5)